MPSGRWKGGSSGPQFWSRPALAFNRSTEAPPGTSRTALAARLDDLQHLLGEGPVHESFRTAATVMVTDLSARASQLRGPAKAS